MPFSGPRRANCSFNDKLIEIHFLHDKFGEQSQIAGTERASAAYRLNVKALQDQNPALNDRFGHCVKDAGRRHDFHGQDQALGQFIRYGKRNLVLTPHHLCHWHSKFKAKYALSGQEGQQLAPETGGVRAGVELVKRKR
jgi:hypothetical protein